MLTTILLTLTTCSYTPPMPQGVKPLRIKTHIAGAKLDQEPLKAIGEAIKAKTDFDHRDADGREMGELAIGGKKYMIGIKGGTDKEPVFIGVDQDGDGKITAAEQIKADVKQLPRGRVVWNASKKLRVGGRSLRATVAKASDGNYALQLNGSYIVGKTELEGKTYHLAVIEVDGDGTFGSKGDFWTLLEQKKLDAFNARREGRGFIFSKYSMIEATEPVFLSAERQVRLGKVDQDGTAEISVGPAKEKLEDYLARRNARVTAEWDKKFKGKMKNLIAARGEPDRERTKQPIAWILALDLRTALARAKREKKPLLVDFEADWCVWCKVLDRVTYPDAEVAAFINAHFVPVKLNADLMGNSLTRDYHVRGYPTIAFLDPDGSKTDQISRFEPPSSFMDYLKDAWEDFKERSGEDRD